MLKSLYISNYALIDKLNINFEKGFSVITGETGAGKSILIGALSLLLGNRADSGVLFDKDTKCIVEGVFDISSLNLEAFFIVHELDYDDHTILRREIAVNGKSRAFVNDTPVKLALMKELGIVLVDIHSQHDTLKLNNSVFQLDVIDKYGTNEKLLQKYTLVFKDYKSSLQKLENLKLKNESSRRDEEYFKFQYNELESAQLDEEEIKSLIEKEKLISHGEEVNSVIEMSKALLLEEESSLVDKLSILIDSFSKLAAYHDNFKDIFNRLSSVNIEVKDIAGEMDALIIEGDFDEDSLQVITDRLNTVYSLQQKHSVSTVAELIVLREEFQSKLKGITNLEQEIKQIEESLSNKVQELGKLAMKLNKQRQKSAVEFSISINKLISKLGMPDSEFFVEINELEHLSSKGLDKLDFLFNPNKGGIKQDISKIASGGEMSRLMLAIKSLVTNRKLLPTIVFDEIDSGVSGDIAGKVGNLLMQISENHQLIAITHLPQIAAKAKHHYFVYKENKNGKTTSKINLLNHDERVEEIAKILSDENVSSAARETARGLLG